MIRAEAHSDDRCVEVEFDATPYFHTLTDPNLLALAGTGYRNSYEADWVAEYCAEVDSSLKDMFRYIRLRRRLEDIGFECSVCREDVLAWAQQHRPHLALQLQDLPE